MKGLVMGNLITAEELATNLDLKPDTIKRWARTNIIPSLKLSGKVVRFDVNEVEAALREKAAEGRRRTRKEADRQISKLAETGTEEKRAIEQERQGGHGRRLRKELEELE